jgi:hypothetical protein
MSYRIEAATKEEWAERALSGEKKLGDLKASIEKLKDACDAAYDAFAVYAAAACAAGAFDAADAFSVYAAAWEAELIKEKQND